MSSEQEEAQELAKERGREVAPKRSEAVHSRQFEFTIIRGPMTTRDRGRYVIRPKFLSPPRRVQASA